MIFCGGKGLLPVTNEKSALLSFYSVSRTRQQIADFLGIRSVNYAMKRYAGPLVASRAIVLSFPDRPRSRKQTYQARASIQA